MFIGYLFRLLAFDFVWFDGGWFVCVLRCVWFSTALVNLLLRWLFSFGC